MKLVIFFIAFTLNAFADQKFILNSTRTKDGLRKIEVDLNQDSKVDRIEFYKDDTLVELDQDSMFSGKIDQWTTYSNFIDEKTPVEIIKSDSSGNGIVDRIQSVYHDRARNLRIVTTQVDSEKSGTFDKEFTTVSKWIQEATGAPCSPLDLENLKILKLTGDVSNIRYTMNNGFYVTDWGYKIHQSCLDHWGAKAFPALLKKTMNQGFQCLKELAEKNKAQKKNPNGALINLKKFEYMLQTTPVSIACGEKKYDWTGTSAHASSNPNDKLDELKIKHPFLSLNPKNPKNKTKPIEEEINTVMGTIFHEQFHNIGYQHEDDLEYPYTCSTCCMNKKADAKEEVEKACKICSGNYRSKNDKNYLADLVAWGKAAYDQDRSARAVVNYLKEFPRDRFAIFNYADAASGYFAPVGIEMGKMLAKKFPNQTPGEKAILDRVKEYDSKELKANEKYSKAIAEAYFSMYYDSSPKAAFNVLNKNKEAFKELLRKDTNKAKLSSEEKYIVDDLKTKLESIVKDIWMRGYPKNKLPESSLAYELLGELKLI